MNKRLILESKNLFILESNRAEKGDVAPFFGSGRVSHVFVQGLNEAKRSWRTQEKSLTWKGASREAKPMNPPSSQQGSELFVSLQL